MDFAKPDIPIYFIDPAPAIHSHPSIEIIEEKAAVGVPELVEALLNDLD